LESKLYQNLRQEQISILHPNLEITNIFNHFIL